MEFIDRTGKDTKVRSINSIIIIIIIIILTPIEPKAMRVSYKCLKLRKTLLLL